MNEVCQHEWKSYEAPHDPRYADEHRMCTRCGVVHTVMHVPTPSLYYDEEKYFFNGGDTFFSEDRIPLNKRYMGSRIPPMKLIGLDHPHGDRRLLQIGPGVGQMTPTLLSWGWRVECCEIGEWSSRYLENAYPPITVHRSDWMTFEPPHLYDAITGNHSLEHFADAPAALAKMVASLAPGGKLYLELPAQLFEDGTSNERAWPGGLHNREHFWAFSERTLRLWFEALGLKQVGFANTIRDYEANNLMDFHVVGVKPAA